MRLITWNCARGPLEKKLAALESLKPDIAVLCEAPSPAEVGSHVAWFPADPPGLGVQVRAYGDYTVEALAAGHLPNCVNAVRVSGPRTFNLLAVWTWPAPTYLKALLNGLDMHRELFAAGPTIVAGDFNGNPGSDKPRQRLKWADAHQVLEQQGLVSAYHQARKVAYGDETEPTYLHRRKAEHGFHIDFCFVPAEWMDEEASVRVENAAPWSLLSDHFPVVTDLSTTVRATVQPSD